MGRIKRTAFLVTAACMLLCLVLSATDWLVHEDEEAVKKISVCVDLKEDCMEQVKRGILEIANESRMDVNYISLSMEGREDLLKRLKDEYEGGAQAVILILEDPKEGKRLLSQDPRPGPLVTANMPGCIKGMPDISFDLKGAAEEMAGQIEKEQGTEKEVVLMSQNKGISSEVCVYLQEALAGRGIRTRRIDGTKEQLRQSQSGEKGLVYVGCWIDETELAAEVLDGGALYGVGCSGMIADRMREGRVASAEAFGMYEMGILAAKQAISVIETGKGTDQTIVGRLITKENLQEEEDFLEPIH